MQFAHMVALITAAPRTLQHLVIGIREVASVEDRLYTDDSLAELRWEELDSVLASFETLEDVQLQEELGGYKHRTAAECAFPLDHNQIRIFRKRLPRSIARGILRF